MEAHEHVKDDDVDEDCVEATWGCNRFWELVDVSFECGRARLEREERIARVRLLRLPSLGDMSESVPPASEQAFSQLGHRPSASGPCNHYWKLEEGEHVPKDRVRTSAKCSVQKIFPQHKVLHGRTAYSKLYASHVQYWNRENEFTTIGVPDPTISIYSILAEPIWLIGSWRRSSMEWTSWRQSPMEWSSSYGYVNLALHKVRVGGVGCFCSKVKVIAVILFFDAF